MIRKKDGIHVDIGKKIVFDSISTSGDINIVSHAHSDHMKNGEKCDVICSELTSKLAEARSGSSYRNKDSERIELLDSGHILGSRAAIIRDDERILYTGDVSTSKRLYMEGFTPVEADKLVIESTYGIPSYKLPEQEKVVKNIKNYISKEAGPFILFGYSLGKAQKLNFLLNRTEIEKVLVSGSIEKMNDVVVENTELDLEYRSYSENKEVIDSKTAMIFPSRTSNTDWVENLKEKINGVKLGFSGWAVEDSFKHRGGYDRTFCLSDHCGFSDLIELVKNVDPEKVYTQHGFDEALAAHLRKEHGYDATALKKNQSRLNDF